MIESSFFVLKAATYPIAQFTHRQVERIDRLRADLLYPKTRPKTPIKIAAGISHDTVLRWLINSSKVEMNSFW
jgi:hypothetical protein